MGYIHVEIETSQTSKRVDAPCGDFVDWKRTEAATTLVCSDGIGSGIKAHIAARMCVARIIELLRQGVSLREAFARLVETMNRTRGTDLPYAVFTVVRILNDGVATVLSYEMPEAILISAHHASVLPQRTTTLEHAIIGEATCHLEPGESLMVVSDGITQAGLGAGLANGWGIEGACRYVTDSLRDRVLLREIPEHVLRQARLLCRKTAGDDCTVAMATCRWGKTVNIFTGPPSSRKQDAAVVRQFLLAEGSKVVCGGTTAQIVSTVTQNELELEPDPTSLVAPPRFRMKGIDLVTEGAVTLNQAYNILDEDPRNYCEESGVTELCALLRSADRVNFVAGAAVNPASEDISFRQQGILLRRAIIPLIVEKLRQAGKLVTVTYV